MRTRLIIALAALGLALPALAQPDPQRDRPARPGRQPAEGLRGQWDGPRGRMPLSMLIRRLPEELQLTDEQREQYDEIAERYRALTERGGPEELRELAQEYRAARERGDTARADELREQMRTAAQERTQLATKFLDEVEPILDEQQRRTLERFRDRVRRPEAAPLEMQRLLEVLPDELELNPEQRAAFDKFMAEYEAGRSEQRARFEELRPLMEELRAARAAGDTDRVQELQLELMRRRPAPVTPYAVLQQLEPLLTDEQRTKLADLRERYRVPDDADAPAELRAILEAARRVDLKPEQRDRMRDIIREATRAGRGRLEPEQRAKLAETTKQEILKLLDAEQTAEFERLLERASRDSDRGRRGGDRERPGPRERPAPRQPGDDAR